MSDDPLIDQAAELIERVVKAFEAWDRWRSEYVEDDDTLWVAFCNAFEQLRPYHQLCLLAPGPPEELLR